MAAATQIEDVTEDEVEQWMPGERVWWEPEGEMLTGTVVSQEDNNVSVLCDADDETVVVDASILESYSMWQRATWAMEDARDAMADAREKAYNVGKPLIHYGWLPFIIYVGMNTEPKPSIWALINPS